MLVLLVNAAAVVFMAGFIWTMQLVHYPLFDRVGADAFAAYEQAHNRLFFQEDPTRTPSDLPLEIPSRYDETRRKATLFRWDFLLAAIANDLRSSSGPPEALSPP